MSLQGYLSARTSEEAVEALLKNPQSRVIAGGTDLLVYLREGELSPEMLVDVTTIPALRKIEQLEEGVNSKGVISIGAALTHAEISKNPIILANAPLLGEACNSVGAPQTRNMATIGGNVVNAAVAADTLSALAVLEATFDVATSCGRKNYTLEEFFKGPGKTVLGQGDILTNINIPTPPKHNHSFIKIARRRAVAISRLSVAVMVAPEENFARVAVGSVFPTPRRLTVCEEELLKGFDREGVKKAALAAKEFVHSISGDRPSMVYKLPVVATALEKALLQALNLPEGK
jgi:CO/xanthine dehydrogenase FAD-binding subunit